MANMIIKELENKGKKFQEITIRKPKVKDFIKAERITGTTEGLEYAVALISQICLFDGKKIPPEEIEEMEGTDFLQLSGVLTQMGLEIPVN